jgi:hypothetical protein
MKPFGIRVTMPPTDPMRKSHLLGEDWEAFRWFETEAERDAAFENMDRDIVYYRDGDNPSQILSKIER